MKTLLLTLCVLAFPLHAETPEVTDAAEKAFKSAEAELVITVKKLSELLANKQIRENFDRAQIAWRHYRDTEARFLAGVTSQGGSAYTVDFLSLQTALTTERTKQLQKIIAND